MTRTALEIDVASRSVRLDGGDVVAAKTLVLATGVMRGSAELASTAASSCALRFFLRASARLKRARSRGERLVVAAGLERSTQAAQEEVARRFGEGPIEGLIQALVVTAAR